MLPVPAQGRIRNVKLNLQLPLAFGAALLVAASTGLLGILASPYRR